MVLQSIVLERPTNLEPGVFVLRISPALNDKVKTIPQLYDGIASKIWPFFGTSTLAGRFCHVDLIDMKHRCPDIIATIDEDKSLPFPRRQSLLICLHI